MYRIGLPVLRTSSPMNSSALASNPSASRRIARLRSDGVVRFHDSNARAAARQASPMSAGAEIGAWTYTSPRGGRGERRPNVRLARRGVDDVQRSVGLRVAVLAVDEVLQQHSSSVKSHLC